MVKRKQYFEKVTTRWCWSSRNNIRSESTEIEINKIRSKNVVMKERIEKMVRNKTEKETGLEMKETRTTVNEIKIE